MTFSSKLNKEQKAALIELPDFWTTLPGYVKTGIEKSVEQAKNGQTKTYEEVKTLLKNRKWL